MGEGTTLTPRLGYVRQSPRQVTDAESPVYYDCTAERWTGSLTSSIRG